MVKLTEPPCVSELPIGLYTVYCYSETVNKDYKYLLTLENINKDIIMASSNKPINFYIYYQNPIHRFEISVNDNNIVDVIETTRTVMLQ
jgi:hypothetical protein